MRDRFVGDIGDYGKYGLLRALCGISEGGLGEKLSLGIVWYFAEDRAVDYLDKPERFKVCDQQLFHELKGIVARGQRNIQSIASGRIFPDDTSFVPDPVPANLGRRQAWLEGALRETRGCDLVFLDPDNGLASVPIHEGRISAKHAYCEELEPFLRRGQSLVAWHQPGFLKGAVPLRLAELKNRFPGNDITALTYHRVVFRAFFVISGRKHQQLLDERIARLLKGPWGQHFEEVPLP